MARSHHGTWTEHMLDGIVDRHLDIRGEVCPYTFVWTKLALEEMEPGQILRVVLDHLPATTNVPRSARAEGHRVLAVVQIGETDWEVVIQKM